MLIEITEPTTNQEKEREIAIGIDLGTTNSLVAISENGLVEVVPVDAKGDERGENKMLPSILNLVDGKYIVGDVENAEQKIITQRLISAKRFMGRGLAESLEDAAELGYQLDNSSENVAKIKFGDKYISAVEASAEYLKTLKDIAENYARCDIKKAVITVPAYFNDGQRQATKDAAEIAGLQVLRLINEPTAAALAYGLDNAKQGIYAIFDMGGGTFDVSILKMQMGVFKVIAVGGDTKLGGDDFDFELAKIIAEKTNSKKHLSEIKSLAKKLKEKLSDNKFVKAEFDGVKFEIEKHEFLNAIRPIIDRAMSIFEKTIRDSKTPLDKIEAVVLVGGSTRIPEIKNLIKKITGKKPFDEINPDEVVARGAALQADGLTNGSDNLLIDVIPLSLGIETYGGLYEVLLARNSAIPATVTQKFTTYEDGQGGMKIHALQGEREMAKDNRSLAKFDLRGIPPKAAGTAVVAVTFEVDSDGILKVTAEEETTKTKAEIEVKPTYGLNAEEMQKILFGSIETAKQDIIERVLNESRVEAQVMLKNLEGALAKDAQLIDEKYRKEIENQIKIVLEACKGTNRELIDSEAKNLDALASDFADERVTKALSGYLSGKKVAEI